MLKAAVKQAVSDRRVWRAIAPLRAAGWVVLTYHRVGGPDEPFKHVPATVFRRQMEWLKANCDVIDPRTLLTREIPARGARPAVLITFDDGYRDYREHAYPVLRDLGLRAINFLPTRFIDQCGAFWWDLLDAAVRHTTRTEAVIPGGDGRRLTLDASGRLAFGQACKAALKQYASPDRASLFDEALAALGFTRNTVPLMRQMMTWDEVREVADITTCGGHTHSHPILPLVDAVDLEREICTGRDRIADETGTRPWCFAYPSGAYDTRAVTAVARAGFTAAFTTVEGFNTTGGESTDAEWLRINRIHAPRSVPELAWTLAGWSVRAV